MTLGSRLQKLRSLRKVSLNDICKTLGLSPLAYIRYERNYNQPNYKTLIALARLFDVSVAYLECKSDDPGVPLSVTNESDYDYSIQTMLERLNKLYIDGQISYMEYVELKMKVLDCGAVSD